MIKFNCKAINRLRRMNKMTSAELAEILDKNPRTISVWENTDEVEKVKITVGVIVELCNHFNLSPEFFFENSNKKSQEDKGQEKIPVNPLTYQILTDFRKDVKELNEKYIHETERLNHFISEKEIEIIQLKCELREKEKEIGRLRIKLEQKMTKEIVYQK